MAIAVSNLTSGSSTSAGSIFNYGQIAPTSNDLILMSISARRSDSTQPVAPTVTGNGLTWVEGTEVYYDQDSTTRKSLFIFRALGNTTAGSGTISFGTQSISAFNVIVDDVSGIDTSGANGAGAIVQAVIKNDTTGTAAGLSITLAAFSGTDNSTYGAFANDAPNPWVPGVGYTQKGSATSASVDIMTEFEVANNTTVNGTFTNIAGVRVGGIGMELKVVASAAPSTFLPHLNLLNLG